MKIFLLTACFYLVALNASAVVCPDGTVQFVCMKEGAEDVSSTQVEENLEGFVVDADIPVSETEPPLTAEERKEESERATREYNAKFWNLF